MPWRSSIYYTDQLGGDCEGLSIVVKSYGLKNSDEHDIHRGILRLSSHPFRGLFVICCGSNIRTAGRDSEPNRGR